MESGSSVKGHEIQLLIQDFGGVRHLRLTIVFYVHALCENRLIIYN